MKKEFTIPFEDISLGSIDLVGGKNASLGEMTTVMKSLGIKIPKGFAITTNAYQAYVEHNKLSEKISKLLTHLDVNDINALNAVGTGIRNCILNGEIPEAIKEAIIKAYNTLSQHYQSNQIDVAVRSSATAEDLPNASFAGQQETYLNISSATQLLEAIKKCYASLFTDRAISYRESMGFEHTDVLLSVGVQKMVRSDIGTSGVAFSLDTESGFKDVVLINATYGLGEPLVQGMISPDEYLYFKPTGAIIEKKLGSKSHKMVYNQDPTNNEKTIVIDTPIKEQHQFCLTDVQMSELATWVMKIEQHYSKVYNKWCPVDVEWAIDGNSNDLFLVQARPETIHSMKKGNTVTTYKINKKSTDTHLLSGIAVGDKIGFGTVRILNNLNDAALFQAGDVLVTDMTDPDWEPLMKKAAAIITNKGGRTCHAAIVARELGVPAIVGAVTATDILKDQYQVTVSCAEGETGFIYNGKCDYTEEIFHLDNLPEIHTPLMLNVGSPDLAFKFSFLPNSGIGLAREEFIISNYIKVHPLALLQHRELGDADLSQEIEGITKGYASEKDFFIEKLAQGVAKIGAAFYNKPVIVRFSDFKSNEYMNLLGGHLYEPDEENPMIGWRGASRYYSEEYKEAFGLECLAIKKAREEMGLNNIVVMIPFCRTIEELKQVLAVMKANGLERGKAGLQVYLMAEVPSNFILAEQFAAHIDGFSIGSNDLTQLTLGLDRDSSLVSHIYDERNEAVKAMITILMEKAKKSRVKVGICGQGPSDFPDFAQFLVSLNIDSISVTPDSVLKTQHAIHDIESQTIKMRKIS